MARNSVYNQGANVSLGDDPSNQLRQFASSGGNYTSLQRDPRSLEGGAGNELMQSQILQQGSQMANNIVNTGLNLYTDEKTRQFKISMFNKIRQTEQSLINVEDPVKHKEIYTATMNNLKDEFSSAGIMKTNDIDHFNTILSQYSDQYNKHNVALIQNKVGNDLTISNDTLKDNLNVVKGDFALQMNLINHQAEDNYNTMIENGFSESDAKKQKKKIIIESMLAGANSIANPLNQSTYYKNLSQAKDGKYLLFENDLNGDDRAKLLEKIKHDGGNDEYQAYQLEFAKNKDVSDKTIIGSALMNDGQKANLLSHRQSWLRNFQANQFNSMISQRIQSDPLFIHDEKEIVSELSDIKGTAIGGQMTDQYLKERKQYVEGDAIGKILETPIYQNTARNDLMNLIANTGGNKNSVLSNKEKLFFGRELNKLKTPDEKIAFLNFQHPSQKPLFDRFNIEDPNKLNKFLQDNKALILKDLNATPHEEMVANIMANNSQYDNALVNKLLNDSIAINEGKKINESDEIKNEAKYQYRYNNDKALRYFARFRQAQDKNDPMNRTYNNIGALAKQGYDPQKIVDALNLGVIEKSWFGKMDLHYNKNQFNESELVDRLNYVRKNYKEYKSFLQNYDTLDEKLMDKRKTSGEWRSNGDDGFVLGEEINGQWQTYGYLPITKINGVASLNIPELEKK